MWSVCLCASACPVCPVPVVSRLPPVSFYRYPLSQPLIRSSRGRSGAVVGWDGCEVRLCVRVPVCVSRLPPVSLNRYPVCVPAPPVSFYRYGTQGRGDA